MPAIVVLTGGGVQGAVLAARAAQDDEPVLLHVDYGQPAAGAEAAAVGALTEWLPSARAVTLRLSHAAQLQEQLRGSSAVGASSEAASRPPVVATRGLMPLLLSAAVQCAQRVGASTVVAGLSQRIDASHVGLSGTDGQPDRQRDFLHAYNMMLEAMLSPPAKMFVNAPLMDLSYAQVVMLAFRFQVPLEKTWSCVRAGPKPCERCESCQTRAAALAEADLIDPLIAPAVT